MSDMSLPARYLIEHESTLPYHYLVFLPKGYATGQDNWPLLLFLHGSGERGDDPELVTQCGLPHALNVGDKRIPFVVVAPQCPQRQKWEPDNVIRILNDAAQKYRIDARRVYLTGLSMGGYGVWATAAAYPERFAAIAPICGGGAAKQAKHLKDLPIWVFHGLQDTTVSITHSIRMVNALNELDANVKFTIYPNEGHAGAWEQAYRRSTLFTWLLQHTNNQHS